MAFDLVEHPSQSPDALASQRAAGLASGALDPKFHYETDEQVAAWLRVHEAHSPARTDAATRDLYAESTAWLLARPDPPAHLVSLGSGGAQKDAALLERLAAAASGPVHYTAVDVGRPMVLASLQEVAARVPGVRLRGVVADVTRVDDPAALLAFPGKGAPVATAALVFGLIPNFPPSATRALLTALTRRGGVCLVSANLAPGPDYAAGTAQVLPQYDNPATRDWLALLPRRLGVAVDPGLIRFGVAPCPGGSGWLRIEAHVVTGRGPLRLLFSYRHTPERFAQWLDTFGLAVAHSWVSPSGEEGVFAVTAASAPHPRPAR